MISLNEIEEKIDINKFIYNGENIWPIFRNAIGWEIALQTNILNSTLPSKVSQKKILLLKIFFKNIVFLIISLFKKYDYVVFTTSDDYREIDGKLKNRLTDNLLDKYKNSNILEIQAGFDIKKSSTKRDYLPQFLFLIFVYIFSKFTKINDIVNIENELQKLNISIDAKRIIKNYISNQKIHKLFFKIYKPKRVFVTCYSYMQMVKLANDMKIDTVEFQHGIIENHFAYDVKNNINSLFYPQNIVIFGINTLKYLEQRFYSKNIFPVGNMLVDYYSKKTNEYINSLKKEYKLIICVSLQWTVINDTIKYIEKQAKNYKDICFILIPRNKDELLDYINKFNNIKILENINCYEIASNSDYHMTCYSTCALEAPSLGVENIFLNINNLSEKYLGKFITEKEFNHLVNFDESLNIILNKNRITKSSIIVQNEDNIKSEYNKNIEILYKHLEQK